MTIKQQLIPLRIGKGLLSLVALFVMLLAPQRAWATVYTTGTLSEGSDGPKYIWAVSGTLNDFEVYASSTDAGSVTESSGSLIVNQSGCEISASGPSSVSDYFIKIFKVKIFGTNLDNNKIAVKVKHYSGDVTFTASSTAGEFFLTTPEGWDSYGDELSIVVNGACTITGIEIHSTQFSSSDSYGWADTPIDGVNAINGAKQNDGSLSVNMKEHSQYTYSFSYTTKQISISSISYSSSNTSVATVADGGVVTLVGAGTTVIFATVPLDDSNSITFGYNLTVTNNAISYGLTVAGVEVTSDNFSAITGEYIQGTVSFTPAEGNDPATLTLNNATIVVEQGDEPNEFPCISYSGSNNLTIKLIGDNTVENKVGVSAIRCYSEEPGSLTFTKGNAQPCSLQLSSGDDSVIDGFSDILGVNDINNEKGNSLVIANASVSYSVTKGLYTGEETPVSSATITSGYGISVAGVVVHAGNKDNVLGTQGDATPTVSFTPANTTTTPATPATLTLNGVNYSPEDGDVTPLVVSSLDNLTVKLAGSNSVYVSSQAEVFPEAAFVSTNSDAVLTFTTNESTNLQLLNTNTIELASGFSSIAFTGYLYRDQNMVKNLLAPTPSMDDNYLQIGRAGYEPDATTFNYVIEYEDESQSVNGTYDMSKTASENNIVLDKPCTVTVFAQYGTLKSAEKVGKLFGFKTSSVTVAKGKSIDIPEIVPAYNADDKLVFAFQSADDNIATVDAQTNKITGAKTGTTTVTGNVTYSGETPLSYQILNYSGNLSNLEITVLLDPQFCFSDSEDSPISDGRTNVYYYGYDEEQILPVLKRWDDNEKAYLTDLSGFNITYTSSDNNVATISNTGVITIVGVGLTEIRASIEATEEYAADEAWFTMEVIPAVPQVSIQDGAYFTGQKLTLTRRGNIGSIYYSFGYEEDESKRTPYDGEISLPKGEYLFYPYTRCGTDENLIWSDNYPIELYVYDEPTISKDEGDYVGDIEVEITNLPHSDQVSVTAYYYLGDDEDNAKLYTTGDKITVRESTKLNVYLLVEGDSDKRYKTKVIERQYKIKDIPLDVTAADFHNHWMTYYHNENGNVGLPENQNIGAYVATSISGNEIVVTQIKSIPRGEPVLLNNETTTTTTNVFGQDVQGNLLLHAAEDLVVDEEQGDYYGLYNGAFMHVKGTIPAGKNYLMVPNAVVPGGNAPKLTIVIDGEATGVNGVRSKMEDVRGDIYDLQGRKVQKPSKKGLYINKGHKVVVK